MALTRRFYDKLAMDLRNARPTPAPLLNIWLHCVTITANNLALNHAAFKRDMFYEACGVTMDDVAAATE